MKMVAKGFYEMSDSRYDVAAALLDRRILPTPELNSSIDIGRVNDHGARRAASHRRRAGPRRVADDYDKDFREADRCAASRCATMMASNHAPDDWPLFMKHAMNVESDRHDGTMGWIDEPWYAALTRFVEQQHAPAEARVRGTLHARDRVLRLEARDRGDHPVLLKAREDGIAWINEDIFRDGATVALLQTGDDRQGARPSSTEWAQFAARKPGI